MTAIEIVVIIVAVLVVLGVLAWTIYRKIKAKKMGVPYTCCGCEHAKNIKDNNGKCNCCCSKTPKEKE